MYKRVCRPIVIHKYNEKRERIEIYDITVITSKGAEIEVYHSGRENCLIVNNYEEGIHTVNGLLKINGFKSKIVSTAFNTDWYNISWVNVERNYTEMHGIKRKEKVTKWTEDCM